MTFLTREQAHQAVETACNYILADKFDTQEKLLMFDNYSQAVCFCVVAGLIEPDWLEDLLDYIQVARQVAREAVFKK